jgi:FAD/FMN-containing dehydrogenase/Fe-S oxidoreductase
MFKIPNPSFTNFANTFEGEFYYDETASHEGLKMVYATDASVYQEKPLAVAIPKTDKDVKKLIELANKEVFTIIPRAAGTSLAGQVVGSGMVVDISKYFNKIIEVNKAEKWVRVQPGVIRNDLNAFLEPFGLLFGPETSTASRAMIGGMIGNNSCGLHSIIWGSVRENLHEIKGFLSDGSEVIFGEIDQNTFEEKCSLQNLEGKIYREIATIISSKENQKEIEEGFPNKKITRRNTGYALDILIDSWKAMQTGGTFNMCKLVAGSEGTLCFVTEAKLKLLDLPPKEVALVAVHCNTMRESLLVNLIALNHKCSASELVDKLVLDLAKTNVEQAQNRSFVEGDPEALLLVEFHAETPENLEGKTSKFINNCQMDKLGYVFPILRNDDCKKAWEMRKAVLGILFNQKGDTIPTNLIEDAAVAPEDLPDYIDEIETLLKKHHLDYSIAAHAGAGELHVTPMMNLRNRAGKELFRTILVESLPILKKYNGSLSGEHGDGRLRGEFIPYMMGEKNYALFKQVKHIFDPKNIFNKGKITDSPVMNEFMRVDEEVKAPIIKTVFDFTDDEGILKLAEKCIGSGDCRKTEITGGTMCPSYMATRAEKDSTRARANMLRYYYSDEREVISNALINAKENDLLKYSELNNLPPKTYNSSLITHHLQHSTKEVLDLCLSCKGCKTECPSSVDVGKMKAEFMQDYYDKNGVPFRSKLIGNFTKMMKLASLAPWAYNFIYNNAYLRKTANRMVGFHPDRTMPHLAGESLRKWWGKGSRFQLSGLSNQVSGVSSQELGISIVTSNLTPDTSMLIPHTPNQVFIFVDEFTNYNDAEIGKKLIMLLQKLGYEVKIVNHVESGRTYLSKGLVREAQKLAIKNVEIFKDLISENAPLIGIEPSAILTFRDEYLDLVPANLKEASKKIAINAFLFEEWFALEIEKGNIKKELFTKEQRLIKLHGHCHQKALSSLVPSKKAMALPENYEVQLIPSGCCGMAGSFGYETEHYDVSMQIGELVLFPTVRKQPENVIIAASGTSCRHQILDGTGKIAKHPIEVLWEALD